MKPGYLTQCQSAKKCSEGSALFVSDVHVCLSEQLSVTVMSVRLES